MHINYPYLPSDMASTLTYLGTTQYVSPSQSTRNNDYNNRLQRFSSYSKTLYKKEYTHKVQTQKKGQINNTTTKEESERECERER